MRTISFLRIPAALAAAAISALLTCHTANAREDVRVDIYEYGLYESSPEIGAEPITEYGFAHDYVASAENIEVTQIVPGRVGLQFGVRFVVHAASPGSPIWIRTIVRFPPQGLQNPERADPAYMDEWLIERVSGEETFYLWPFEKRWHIEPGIWAIEFWHGDELLGEQQFEVVTPPLS